MGIIANGRVVVFQEALGVVVASGPLEIHVAAWVSAVVAVVLPGGQRAEGEEGAREFPVNSFPLAQTPRSPLQSSPPSTGTAGPAENKAALSFTEDSRWRTRAGPGRLRTQACDEWGAGGFPQAGQPQARGRGGLQLSCKLGDHPLTSSSRSPPSACPQPGAGLGTRTR